MPAGKKQICPDWNISKSVAPITTSGKISFWPLAVLVALIVFAGVSIYRVVDLHAKVRVVLKESTTQTPKIMASYKIPRVTQVTTNANVTFENEAMVENGTDVILADRKLDEQPPRIESTFMIVEKMDSAGQQLDDGLHTIAGQVKSDEDKRILYVKVPVGRIRQEASLDAKNISRLYKGERVTVLESSRDWYRIDTDDGRKGWAHGKLFSKDAPRSIKSAKPLIKAIWVEELTEEKGKIFIELDGYHLPKTLVLEGDRPRVACDFYGIEADPTLQKSMAVNTGIIRSIRLGVHGEGKAKTRVVIDLLPNKHYVFEQQYFMEENTYLLEIHCK